jgi:hypothetical protein
MTSTLARFDSLDFYQLDILKSLVCAAPVDNEDAISNRIVDASPQLPRRL